MSEWITIRSTATKRVRLLGELLIIGADKYEATDYEEALLHWQRTSRLSLLPLRARLRPLARGVLVNVAARRRPHLAVVI